MKKLLLITLLLITTSAFAQTTKKSQIFGVKAGINLYHMHYANSDSEAINSWTNNTIGFNFTVLGGFSLSRNLFFEPGISLQRKGNDLEYSYYSNFGGTVSYHGGHKLTVLEFPLNLLYRIPAGKKGAILVNAGPYVAFNLAGKSFSMLKDDNKVFFDNSDDVVFGNLETDGLSRTDFGLNLGLAFRLNKGISVGTNYGFGIANMIPEKSTNKTKMTNRVLGFNVGYAF